jgi:hypothetical protein
LRDGDPDRERDRSTKKHLGQARLHEQRDGAEQGEADGALEGKASLITLGLISRSWTPAPPVASDSAHECFRDSGGQFGAEYRCDLGLEVVSRALQSSQHLSLRLIEEE